MLLCELFQNKTLPPEFYAWFGDSKAVNADGSPDLRKSLRGDLRESDDSNILYHITPTKNLPTILTHGLVPRIGKRSRRLGETTPAIYFFPDMESVENALMNWLGDEFSDNTRLALLQVSIPPNVDIKSDAGFERHITMPVTPDRIKVLSKSITDVVDVKSLNENAHQPTTFSKEAVIEVIRSCQKKFGEGFLYHGNCGSFAIALSKWIAERFMNVKVGLLAPIVVFNFDGDEALISENAVDYNHVFSLVSLNGKYILFDGSGEVTKQGLLRWHKDTMDWYEECGFDSGPGEGRVINAIGDIHSEAVVSCVECGTDPMMDWTDFYEFLNTGKLTEDSDVVEPNLSKIEQLAKQKGVDLKVAFRNNQIWLESIKRVNAKPGVGAVVMKLLCKFADKHNLPIHLIADSMVYSGIHGDSNSLVQYYEQFGFQISEESLEQMEDEEFELDDFNPEMIRLPVGKSLTEGIEIVHDRFRNEDDDDYVYHVTLEPLAQRILQQGFMPNRRPTMTNYAGYSKGKVFFTERSGVSFWEERVEQHAENNMDDPPPVAVLRVPKEEIGSLLQPDPVGTRDSHASCYFITEPFKPTN